MLDGGTRLLGRVLPIGRGWRLAIVTLAGRRLRRLDVLFRRHRARRAGRAAARDGHRRRSTASSPGPTRWASSRAGVDVQQLSGQLMGTLGRLGSAVGSALGAVTSAGHDPRHRHLHRGRAAALRARRRLDAAAGARDRFYRTAEPDGLHDAPADGRAPARHGGRGRRHLAAAAGRRRADGGAARHPDRPARLPPQYRRDHLGRADRARRLLGQASRRGCGRSPSISSSRPSTAI